MTTIGWIQILLYVAIIAAITPVLGGYMTRVFNGERTFLTWLLRPVELALYRLGGVHANYRCRALLGPCSKRPRSCRAADKRDELSPSHSSILMGAGPDFKPLLLGSQADVSQCARHVCFTPESRHGAVQKQMLLWARSGPTYLTN